MRHSAARRDGDMISSSVAKSGQWEAGLVSAILARLNAAAAAASAALQRSPVFLDIGANIGTYTLAVAAAGHRVIAIEPLASNTVALRRSLCRNAELVQRVLLLDKALGGGGAQDCVMVSGLDNKVLNPLVPSVVDPLACQPARLRVFEFLKVVLCDCLARIGRLLASEGKALCSMPQLEAAKSPCMRPAWGLHGCATCCETAACCTAVLVRVTEMPATPPHGAVMAAPVSL